MNKLSFSQLGLSEEISQAIDNMGFENATEIQLRAIPIIKQGLDVIGRSQTGTGKTLAFGVPAVEALDVNERAVQILILCPTRELAVQACEEIQKLSKFKPGVKTADIYGGAPMDRQIFKLRSANIVIGTPGRIMDHMRRKTLKLNNLKMIILDEADEMLSMGFREDIETILTETPQTRQTILFSATMPPEILAITKKYQKNPQLVEINKKQVTVSNIEQYYYDVPSSRKMDALNFILRYHSSKLSMIFCNTKRAVDEITQYLDKHGFSVEGLHGDMKQSQRTKVMNSFKNGKTLILVATDVAARGIDVNNIEYVINYDIPQNTEYYVHRIGRTGRAGKDGKAITICSGRRQVEVLTRICRLVKSNIEYKKIPTLKDIQENKLNSDMSFIETLVKSSTELPYMTMANNLVARGYDPIIICAALLELQFGKNELHIDEIPQFAQREDKKNRDGSFEKIKINIGRKHKIAPNHIVGAITQRTNLCGKDIGKIEIFDNETIVSIPSKKLEQTVDQMKNCKICGTPTITTMYKKGFSRKAKY